jgi:hypothetical protein
MRFIIHEKILGVCYYIFVCLFEDTLRVCEISGYHNGADKDSVFRDMMSYRLVYKLSYCLPSTWAAASFSEDLVHVYQSTADPSDRAV